MNDAIGMIETKGLLPLIEATDAMAKAANVEIVKRVDIGGGFITTVVSGDVGSVRAAVEAGADEIDMVIHRGAFLSGQYQVVADEIRAVKEACAQAHLKVILETGELETYDNVVRASELAISAGADFIKTSTGKVSPAATMPVTLVMLETIRSHFLATGQMIGMKPAGGISTAKDALHYLVMLKETLGDAWLTPEWFRFGASSLLNDVLLQLHRLESGQYTAHYDVTES